MPPQSERRERQRNELMLYIIVCGVVVGEVSRNPWGILIGAVVGGCLATWKHRRERNQAQP